MKFKQESLGFRIILKPYIVGGKERRSEGGIDLSAVSDRMQAVNTDRGEVYMVGPEAFKEFGYKSPYSPGDNVFYSKYGAKVLKDEKTDELYILCNDEDILVAYLEE